MINAIDLFCGIGGLTKGLTLANINVVAGIDNDATCEFAYETNNHTYFICENVEDISGDDLRDCYPQEGIKLLVGCAPCQPFSRHFSRYRETGRVAGFLPQQEERSNVSSCLRADGVE